MTSHPRKTPTRKPKDAGAQLVAPGSELTRAEQPRRGGLANVAGVVSPNVSAFVAMYAKRSRYNPIRQLSPEYLSRIMDIFQNGYLREFALMADAIKRRDPVVQVCTRKREKGVARHGIKIIITDELQDPKIKARAAEHKAALTWFYDHLHARNVLEQDQQGGARLLVEQMMEAVYFRYAVHEIVWRPMVDPITGEMRLTADFNYVPLQFFESSVGHLRFNKRYFGTIMGEEMDPKQWLVTVGDGLCEPIAVAYMMKWMSLKDWMSFSERFGTPGLIGKTKAAYGSPGWNQMVTDLAAFAQHWSAVTNVENEITLIQPTSATGNNTVFEPLAQYMDKAIATLVRGADLATISSGKASQGRGASLQGDETALIEEDDAALITENLRRIDELVISWLFNDPVCFAHARVIIPDTKQTTDTIAKLTFLVSNGVEVGQDYAREELGVPKPGDEEELLTAPAPAAPFGGGSNPEETAAADEAKGKAAPGSPEAAAEKQAVANALARGGVTPALLRHDARMAGKLAVFRATALERLLNAQRGALEPLLSQLREVGAMADDTARKAALMKLQADLPRWYRRIASDPALANALEEVFGSALVSSAAEASAARTGRTFHDQN
jgi:phage gp29-like protein